MGRIRTSKIKSVTGDLIEANKNKFKSNFEHNKKVLADVADIPSKHLRNVIAGYITKLLNQEKESKSLK
ncbi:MAG: 30S ribosomal protein S17e [Candidatus Nanoarchaeia archaeon]|nr:30S ribosomal protein S17e [Candidatus Nanoarchaeia archaeon]